MKLEEQKQKKTEERHKFRRASAALVLVVEVFFPVFLLPLA